ncbi:MAG: nickel-responsive transcriptional regulator NikR [Verrucomicrobiota bacterium]
MSVSKKRMESNDGVERFTVCLPSALFHDFERISEQRGFASRSQAIAELVSRAVGEHRVKHSNAVMTGVLTLVYEHRKRDVQNKLTDLQHKYLKEIITVQVVHLERGHSLQVLLMQGPAKRLKKISDELITCKGVTQGKLELSSTILPQIY